MIRGYKIAHSILAQPPLAAFNGKPLYDGHIRADGSDDDAIAELIRNRTDTIYHPVGTCKMGTDPLAVVDPCMRVHGVTGLRVADASVMPALIGGNTNAPAIMLGERAAEFILDEERANTASPAPMAA